MMIAPVGSSLKVSGIRIAIPAMGPIPGSTPTAVPMREPSSAKIRFPGRRTRLNPCSRLCSASIPSTHSFAQRLADDVLFGLNLGRRLLDLLAVLELDQLAGGLQSIHCFRILDRLLQRS